MAWKTLTNHFCATGAIIAAGVAAAIPAGAAEWQLGLGGAVEQTFGYVSYDGPTTTAFEGVDTVTAGQVFILPMVTLGNGLTFGANFHLEGHIGERNAGAEFDEASVYVKTRIGEFRIGKSDTPGNHMRFGAPMGYGPEVNLSGLGSAALPSLLQFSNVHNNRFVGHDLFRGTLGSTQVSNMGQRTQGRISYFSPRFAGFQLGASFAPEEANATPNRVDFFDIGANYVNSFGDVDVGISASWGRADNRIDPTASPEYWGVGLNLGYGNVSVGGSYAESTGSTGGITDGEAFDIGASYQRGRYGLSIHYLSGENVDNENFAIGAREKLQAITLSGSYSLTGPPKRSAEPPRPGSGEYGQYGLQQGIGASIFGFVSYADFTEDVGDAGPGSQGDDVDGFVVGTGFRLTF